MRGTIESIISIQFKVNQYPQSTNSASDLAHTAMEMNYPTDNDYKRL